MVNADKVVKSNAPIFVNARGPFFYWGVLEDKVGKLMGIQCEIEKINRDKNVQPSNSLLRERSDIETEIHRHLVHGEKIDNDFFDYCMRHFSGSCINVNGVDRFKTVFSRLSKVEKFMEYVGNNVGEKILSLYDGYPQKAGVISGPVEFSTERSFRYLHVPVEKLFKFEEDDWKTDKSRGLYVNPDIFSHPGFSFEKGVWCTNHSKETYICGPGPKKTEIYVGNENVKKELTGEREVVIPERTENVSFEMPDF